MRSLVAPTAVAALTLGMAACASRVLPVDVEKGRPLCENLDGIESLLEPGAVLVFGEIHGTVEAPAVVSDVMCHALRQDLSVTLALEIPRQESDLVTAWMASAGATADRAALLEGPFWQSSYQDGRRSEAMAALLDDARRFAVDGRSVAVRLLDQIGASGSAREQVMADALVEAAQETESDLVIALVGNLHARLARGGLISEPMVLRASKELPDRRLVTLSLSSAGGEAWICGAGDSGCGPGALSGGDDSSGRSVRVAGTLEHGYHGVFHVGELHASPPAVPGAAKPRVVPANVQTSSSRAAGEHSLKRPAAVDRPRSEPHIDGEWPRWMGPNGDGAIEPGLLSRGAGAGLRVDWRQPLGRGYSSITVSRGRALTLEADTEGLWLVALDVVDGGEIWRQQMVVAATLARGRVENPLSTPATDGERVYAIGPAGRLFTVAVDDGEVLWSHELARDFGASPPSYGMSTSPLLHGDRLFVLVGGTEGKNLVAFDKKTGAVLQSLDHAELGSYATPVEGVLGGEPQIIVPAGDLIYAVRPDDGSLLWSFGDLPFPDRDPLLLADGHVFFTFQEFATLLEVSENGGDWQARELWRSQRLDSSYSPAVHHRGALFGFDGGRMTCLDAATGEVAWQVRSGNGSLIRVDDHLVVFRPRQGKLELVEATPDSFLAAGSVTVFPGGTRSTTPPSFGAGRIFLRGEQEIVAVRLGASGPTAPGLEDLFQDPLSGLGR